MLLVEVVTSNIPTDSYICSTYRISTDFVSAAQILRFYKKNKCGNTVSERRRDAHRHHGQKSPNRHRRQGGKMTTCHQKMDHVKEEGEKLELLLHSLKDNRKRMEALIIELRKSLMEVMVTNFERFQNHFKEYLIQRNDSLKNTTGRINESVECSIETLKKISEMRSLCIDKFNAITKPTLTVGEGEFLCSGIGNSDFKMISESAKAKVQHLNSIQEQYVCMMEMMQKLPLMITTHVDEFERKVNKWCMQVDIWVDFKKNNIKVNLKEASELKERMEELKQQLQCLHDSFSFLNI